MYKRFVKRVLDLTFSLIAMPIFGLICLFVAPAIRHED